MQAQRYLYSATAFIIVVFTALGFSKFLLAGHNPGGGPLPAGIEPVIIIHGVALLLWVVLFFVQTLLVAVRKRSVHMTLGWATVAVGYTAVVCGLAAAVLAPRVNPRQNNFGLSYPQFMLPMLLEMLAFGTLITLGLVYRKKPEVHKTLFLLATLSVLSGATARIGFFYRFVGETGWVSLFGVPTAFAVLFLIVRWGLTRTFDRGFAVGLLLMQLVYAVGFGIARSPEWGALSAWIIAR